MKRKALACKDIEAERGRLDAGIRDVVSGALVLKGERDAMLDAVCRALEIEQASHASWKESYGKLFDMHCELENSFEDYKRRMATRWKFWGEKA